MSSYLRTRYRALHNRFGTAGVIIAVIALVAALSGTALAAKGAFTPKQKKEVEKIAKKYAGKPGAPGAAGTNGTNGANGKDGAPGAAGKDGEDGADGSPGTPGVDGNSVEIAGELQPGEPGCDGNGGVVYEVEGSPPTEVCNGAQGEPGVIHPGDNVGEAQALPPGATETGGWAFTGTAADTEGVLAPISFMVPMPIGLNQDPSQGIEQVHYVTAGEIALGTQPAACPGTMNIPQAEPGHLCVYESNSGDIVNATFDSILKLSNGEALGASRTGAIIKFNVTGVAHGSGAWAVTAPLPTP